MAAMNATNIGKSDGLVSVGNYRAQLQALSEIRNGIGGVSAGFNEALQASGQYSVETVRTVSRVQSLTKAISEQKLTLSGAIKNWKYLKDVSKQQTALRNSSVMQWGPESKTGRNTADIYIPNNLDSKLTSARDRYGLINKAIAAVAHQTVNWGKNMQWAGRQITVGIGVPVAIAAAGMTALALQADQQLTRITKVYDTYTDSTLSAIDQQMSSEKQLADVRTRAMGSATNMANVYGQSLQDTLGLSADLAAVGKTGTELTDSVAQVTRISTLGELERQDALDMTITLMSAYNQSAKDLTETFDYMNALENSTSLATKDFAEAIPRAGGALANLGVDVKEMGILMVAMKEGGVDAAEGANALKSATTRLLKPTADAKNLFRAMNVNIEDVVADAGGDLLQVLTDLGKKTAGYGAVQRQAAIAALFGTYQFNRLNVAMDNVSAGMAGTANASSQVAEAVRIAGLSTGELAAIADGELQQFQQSASGRFKRAIESIKVELVKLGEPIMAALSPIIEGVTHLFKFFNSLPDGVKKWTMIALAAAAIAGPLIMLVGLFANLMGNVGKFATMIGGLVTRFKLLTPQERAQELLAKRAASAFDVQASSTAQLTLELQRMTTTLNDLHAAQLKSMGIDVPTANAAVNGAAANQTRYRMPAGNGKRSGTFISKEEARTMGLVVDDMDKIENSAAKTKTSFMGMLGKLSALGVGVWAFQNMLDSSGGIANNLMNASMVLAALPLSGIGKTIQTLASKGGGGLAGLLRASAAGISGAFGKITGKVTGSLAGATTTAGKLGKVVTAIGTSFLGWGTAIVGAAAAFMLIRNEMTKTERAQDNIIKSTKTWADILGYVEQQGTVTTGQAQDGYGANLKAVEALTEGNQDLVNSMANAAKEGGNLQAAYNLAEREALKVRTSGGSVAEAKRAFQVALMAGGIRDAELDKLTLKFDSVDLDDPDYIRMQIQSQIDVILSTLNSGDAGGAEPTGIGGWLKKTLLGGDVTDEGRSAFKEAANLFAQGFQSADAQGKNNIAMKFKEQIEDQFAGAFGDIKGNNAETLKLAGVKTADELYRAYMEADVAKGKLGKGQSLPKWQNDLLNNGDIAQFADTYGESLDVVMNQIADTMQLPDSVVEGWKKDGFGISEILNDIGGGTMTTAQASDEYNAALYDMDAKYRMMNDEQKLHILNLYRAKAGLLPVKDLTIGFGLAAKQTTAELQAMSTELIALGDISLDGLDKEAYTGYIKSMYSGAMNEAYSAADRLWNKVYQAEQDGYKTRGEAAQKALDNRGKREDEYFKGRQKALDAAQKAEEKAFDDAWDAREDALDDQIDAVKDAADAKIDAINDEIDALQKADDEREKLFEREKKRIERMAEAYNTNVDFNKALNSGNLDEAAKIRSNASATLQQWGLDDQSDAMGDASQQRQDALKASIDGIEAERDARVKALEAQKDALKDLREFEEEQMKARQEREQEALDAEKQRAQDALQAAKDAQAARTANAIANSQQRQEDNRIKLDQELATIKASTPRNQAEYDNQIAQIEAAYAKYGVNLQAQGAAWSGIIGSGLVNATATAAAQMRDNIAWNNIGNVIQARISSGVGVTMADLTTYLSTGKWPGMQPGVGGHFDGPKGQEHWVPDANHTGGMIEYGGSQKSRTGVPASAQLYPSETLSILKAGEFVVNQKAASKNRMLLERINNGNPITSRSRAIIKGTDSGAIPEGGWISRIAKSFHEGGAVAGFGGISTGVAGIPLMAGLEYGAAIAKGALSAAITKSMSDKQYNGPALGGAISSILTFARSQQGKPYIWGGAGPAGADCSGFMSEIQNAVYGKKPPYGRRWATASFAGGREIDGWKRGGSSKDVFRIGVDPGSHTAGTFGGINVESGSGHGPMVGGRALGANSGFRYQYYLPAANSLPQLRTGGSIRYDNTLANLHKGETVLTAPLTQALKDNVANGLGNEYNVTIDLRGAYIKEDVDVEKAVEKAMEKLENKNGRKRVIK